MRRRKKKAMSLPMQLLVVLIMLFATFLVWKLGVLDKITGLLYSMKYQIDTTEIEACRAVMSKHIGPGAGSLPTDRDGDELPDYICDPCICRDGTKKGTICGALRDKDLYMFPKEIDKTKKNDVGGFYFSLDPKAKSNLGYEEIGYCVARDYEKDGDEKGINIGSPDNIGSCGTNSYDFENDDIDSDLMPDICDKFPNTYEKKPSCHRGRIFDPDGGVIGFIEGGKSSETGEIQCVFTLCSRQLSGDPNFKKYCLDGKESVLLKSVIEPKDSIDEKNDVWAYVNTMWSTYGAQKTKTTYTVKSQ